MAVREYQFVVGPETSELPTAGSPTGTDDTVTLGYADEHYVQGGAAVADITALKAITAANRADKDLTFVESKQRLYWFDASATGTGNDESVVTPSSGSGRWLSHDPYPNIEVVMGKEQTADPSAPSSGYRKLYPKADGWYDKDVNGVVQRVGTSSGAGEINAISNPSAASAVSDYVASGGGIAVARTTSASDLPLSGVISTAVKITPASGTDYVRYRFTMPAALKNKKLKFEWHQRPLSGYATGDLKIEVYKNATAAYDGAYTEFALSTDSSGTSSIPNYTGKYTTYFDADDGDYYEVRWVRTAGTTAINFTSIIVGPGIQPQGALVGEWVSVTPTGSWSANSTYTGRYRRVGDTMEYVVNIALSGAPTSATLTINLPTGFTIDTTKLPATGTSGDVYLGEGTALDSGTANYPLSVKYGSTTTLSVRFIVTSGAGGTDDVVTQAAPYTFANGDKVYIRALFPVSEWSGGGTVNLAQNDVEYAFNSSTSTSANDTTSFGYGPQGAQIQNITASLERRVRFLTPIQATDIISIEISEDRAIWHTLETIVKNAAGSANIESWCYQNGTAYGMGHIQKVNATDLDVEFAQYAFATGAFGAAGDAWSVGGGSFYWRVKKAKAGAPVGFGIVSENAAGLLPATHANLDNATATRLGLKKYSHGTTYNGGNAPTITLAGGGGSLSSVSYSDFMPYQMQDGSWRMRFSVRLVLSSAVRTSASFAIAGVTCADSQPFVANIQNGGGLIPVDNGITDTNNFAVYCPSQTTQQYGWAGDVSLSAKPNWAY